MCVYSCHEWHNTEGIHLQYFRRYFGKNEMQSFIATAALAIPWLVGMIFGACAARGLGGEYRELIQDICVSKGSFFGFFLSMFLPLMLSVAAERITSPYGILPVIFGKGFSLAVTTVTCLKSWGSAGWLVMLLLFAGDILGTLVMLWLWYRILIRKQLARRDLSMAALLLSLVCVLQIFVIVPFLSKLF